MPKITHTFVLLGCGLAIAGCSAVPRAPGIGAPVSWTALAGWDAERPAAAWTALAQSCRKLPTRDARFRDICADMKLFPALDDAIARAFFETRFLPHAVVNETGGDEGLITGYYEPLLNGSRVPTGRFRYPLYRAPDDLVTVELGALYPELNGKRVRGRLDGKRVVPYYSRAEIANGARRLAGNELLWVDDPVALFFLHIQGSGRVRLPSGEMLNVGYADQNGHPYQAIGRRLIEMNVLKPEDVNLQSIRAWLAANPNQASAVLNSDPSYVFFALRDPNLPGPLGALDVPLEAERAIAVDPAFIPLGVPVWLDTTLPGDATPYRRLVYAQDTGGAIKGPVRADLFFGFGDDAERRAGHMKQPGRVYVLLPRARAVE